MTEDPRLAKNLRIALARYLPDGRFDPTFDQDGRIITDLPNGDDAAGGVAIQADGRIVVSAGRAVLRYTSAGAFDPTLGPARTGVAPSSAVAYYVALEPNGKIVTFGPASQALDFSLARLESPRSVKSTDVRGH